MNAPLRKAGVVMMVLFGLLFLNLNYVQVVKAEPVPQRHRNNQIRIQQQEYERQRGEIIVDGQPVAQSVATKDTLKFLRTYPGGAMYAHVVGYEPVQPRPDRHRADREPVPVRHCPTRSRRTASSRRSPARRPPPAACG